MKIDSAASLDRAWEPRRFGAPFASDDAGWKGAAPLISVINTWIEPGGQHVFAFADPCRNFDDVVYYDHLLVRFLATEGKDLYFLSHPTSHHCLERESCAFFSVP